MKDGLLILETAAAAAKLLQSCPTLYNPIDGSPPGSSVPGDYGQLKNIRKYMNNFTLKTKTT